MFFIIWGSRNRVSVVGRGEFWCPNCGKRHPYVHKRAKRWFTLYFIPVFPTQDLGEFVECEECHMTFRPEVLNYKPKRTGPTLSVEDQLKALRYRLEQGEAIEYAVRDLTAAGLDREIALGAVKGVTGDMVRLCPTCHLTYAVNAEKCQECQGALETKTTPAV